MKEYLKFTLMKLLVYNVDVHLGLASKALT